MDTDPGRIPLYAQLLIILALTFVNAFFAMSEMALVSLSKPKLKAIAEDTTDGDARAEKVLLLIEEPNKFLSTIQVVITLAGFLSSAFASYNLSDEFVNLLSKIGIQCNEQLAVVLITVILSYFTLVLGELFPKRLALRDPEGIAMASVGIINLMKTIFMPFVAVLSASVDGLAKLFKVDKTEEGNEYMEEEIMNILEEGSDSGEIDEIGKEMIKSIFDFGEAYAYEVMVPRTDVFMIDINEPTSSFLDELLEERHARIPVYNEDIDDIIGVLYIKDYVIEAKRVGFENVDIKSILKEPVFIPENKRISDVLKELQEKKNKMALVIDEYGGFSGIITVEDIIEEIVGEIEDNDDTATETIIRNDDGTYLVEGLYNLEDLEDEIGIPLEDESENSATVGGFVTELIGAVPDESFKGRTIEYGRCIFTVLEVGDRRIEKVKLEIKPEE